MFCKVSEGIRLLAQQMIDNPDDWRQGPYHFSNVSHPDIRIWTANGDSYIKLEGNDSLTMAEKRHLSAAIKKSIAMRLTA